MPVYVNRGMNLSKSEMKKAMKMQGAKPSKWMLKNPESLKFKGLRTASGDVLLKTVYEEVYPLSASHSVVKMRNDDLKIAEHGTHILSDLPYSDGNWIVFSIYDKTSKLNTYIFLLSVPDPSVGADIATFTPLLADLSLGQPVEHIKTMKNRGYDAWGSHYVLYKISKKTRKARAALFNTSHELLDAEAEIFGVNYGDYKKDGRSGFEKAKSLVALIGPSPTFVGLDETELFWPYDQDGNVLPRPEGVLGMTPVNHEVLVYGDAHRRLYESWLIVFEAGSDYDYALATFGNSSKASDIAAELDRFERLDDVYFKRGQSTGEYFYTLKPRSVSGVEQPWHAYSHKRALGREFLGVMKGDELDSTSQGPTVRSAIDTLIEARNLSWAESAKREAAFDAKQKTLRQEKWTRLYAWQNPTTPTSECTRIYRQLEAHIRNVGYSDRFQREALWMGKYEQNGQKPCDTPPNVPSGAPTYTMQQALEGWSASVSSDTGGQPSSTAPSSTLSSSDASANALAKTCNYGYQGTEACK